MIRLAPRWPRKLVLIGAGFVTAFWLGILVFAAWDPGLKPHQRGMSLVIAGGFALACLVGFARLAARTASVVEVDREPAEPGQDLRVVVTPKAEARLVCLRARGRGVEDRLFDLPVAEGVVRIPPGAPGSRDRELRWCVEVRKEQFPLLVEEAIRYSLPPP
jgi:hypothetical protein